MVFAGAAAAGHGLDDLYLFAVLVDDKMANVDDAFETGVGVVLAVVEIRISGGWVRWVRGRLIHVNTSSVLAVPPGD